MDQPVQLDPAALDRLRRLGGEEFTLKMTNLFLDYGAQKIAEARQALTGSDFPGIAKAVHPIKSSAGNVGALEVQDLATRIEGLAAQAQGDTLPALMEQLEQSFSRVKSELQTLSKS